MRKKIIELSKWHVVALVIFGLGILLLTGGVVSWLKLRAAFHIARFDTEDLRLGKYVKGEITQYAVRETETINGMRFNGISGGYGYGIGVFYDAYTIPAADGKYICVLIRDEELLAALSAYDRGVGEGAFFVGKVEKPKYDVNYDFWEDSVTFESIDEAKEKICDKYVIRQIYPERIRYIIYAGISLLITAWIISIAGGRVKVQQDTL